MVAGLYENNTRCRTHHKVWHARSGLILVAVCALFITNVQAQNFLNTGTYKGSGLFQVRGAASGLPDTVSGTFEYFGTDQRVEAKNYENLLLTGNGTKNSISNNFTILNSVAVAGGVKFQIDSSMILGKLNGRITRENGIVTGRITKTVDFTTPYDTSDFGGIGLSIRSGGSMLGKTDVIRTSGSSITSSNGNKSIKRWCEIIPTDTINLSGNLFFRYTKDELSGQDSTLLDIWRSPNGGIQWRRQHTSRSSDAILGRTGKFLKGLWTAADSDHLLGLRNYEFDPDLMIAASADSLRGKVKKSLDSLFIAKITDVFGNPIPHTRVRFSIANTNGASGQVLSASSDTTNLLGEVSTKLTLGDRKGRYEVLAQVESVPTTQFTFVGYADQAATALAKIFSPPPDTIRTILTPFIVESRDGDNSIVSDVNVQFSIIKAPPGATRQLIIRADTKTDSAGRAHAVLQLGEKVGEYVVAAHSTDIEGVVDTFRVTASHGKPAIALKDNIVRQDTIGKIMPPFTYTVTDYDTNAVPGRSVRFALIQPDSTITDTATVSTDSLGQAKAVFRLGNKAGKYSVSAKDINWFGSERFFAITAQRGLAKTIAQQSGNNQYGQLGDHLQPFVVQVKDAGGNLVPNAGVTFTMFGRPDTLARYDSLATYGVVRRDSVIVMTDSTGTASASLILGNRPGRYTVKASIPGLSDTLFVANAVLLYADVNHDNYRNIGDLTAMIDHAIGRKLLTGYDFVKADMYPHLASGTAGDGIVDIRDVQGCLDSLLKSGWDPTRDWLMANAGPLMKVHGSSRALNSGSTFLTSLTDSCFVQTTYIGSRFSLKNSLPVKGLQAVIYMKNLASLDTADIIFQRASMMKADVKSVGKEVSVILWNANNSPIDPGNDAIFRLPIQLTSNNVDSIHVLVSSGVNNDVMLLSSKQEDIRNSIPREWMLYQNYPNPFNPTTTIEFDVPEIAGQLPRAAVQIFNILGQHVRTIERGIHDAGRYSVRWDGMNEYGTRVASGVYFYRLLAGDYASTKKMVMMK
jgi:hypothetical protein